MYFAGVQFSNPLINFGGESFHETDSWGSVLKSSDKLQFEVRSVVTQLGFSSQIL